jgi:hypothetical protein
MRSRSISNRLCASARFAPTLDKLSRTALHTNPGRFRRAVAVALLDALGADVLAIKHSGLVAIDGRYTSVAWKIRAGALGVVRRVRRACGALFGRRRGGGDLFGFIGRRGVDRRRCTFAIGWRLVRWWCGWLPRRGLVDVVDVVRPALTEACKSDTTAS